MENQTELPGKIRLVRCKSSMLTKIVVLTSLVLSIMAVYTLVKNHQNMVMQTALLEQQAAAITAENQQLEQGIDQLDAPENLRKIAQEELGMVDSGAIVFVPQQ